MSESLPAPWQISPKSTKAVRVYCALLARPHGFRRYVVISVTSTGAYSRLFDTAADAAAYFATEIEES